MKTPKPNPFPIVDAPDYEWYKVTEYDKGNPMLTLYFGDSMPTVALSVRSVPDDRHEWLAEVLHRQISQLITTAVKQTTNKFQSQLRSLAGLE